MSRRGKLIAAGCIGLVGVLVITMALVTGKSARSYLRGKYRVTSSSGNSLTLAAAQSPRAVYDDLARRVKPADTLVQTGGYFVRYHSDIVAITPDGAGSRIYVDDQRTGYSHWYPYVGGHWGTYSGSGEAFRGGGPGSGK